MKRKLKQGRIAIISKKKNYKNESLVRSTQSEHITENKILKKNSISRQNLRKLPYSKYFSTSHGNLSEFIKTFNQLAPEHKIDSNQSISKQFVFMFEILCKKIDKNLGDKKVIFPNIGRILKMLSYPLSVSRITLSSLGSPQTLPLFISLLKWLSELVEYYNKVNHLLSGISQVEKTKGICLWTQLIIAYQIFLSGSEKYNKFYFLIWAISRKINGKLFLQISKTQIYLSLVSRKKKFLLLKYYIDTNSEKKISNYFKPKKIFWNFYDLSFKNLKSCYFCKPKVSFFSFKIPKKCYRIYKESLVTQGMEKFIFSTKVFGLDEKFDLPGIMFKKIFQFNLLSFGWIQCLMFFYQNFRYTKKNCKEKIVIFSCNFSKLNSNRKRKSARDLSNTKIKWKEFYLIQTILSMFLFGCKRIHERLNFKRFKHESFLEKKFFDLSISMKNHEGFICELFPSLPNIMNKSLHWVTMSRKNFSDLFKMKFGFYFLINFSVVFLLWSQKFITIYTLIFT